MAGNSYVVAVGEIAAHDKQLTADTADTVTFAKEVQFVDVLTDGSAAVYVATDGSAAVKSGAGTFKVPVQAGVPQQRRLPCSGTVVSLISAGTPHYSVEAAV